MNFRPRLTRGLLLAVWLFAVLWFVTRLAILDRTTKSVMLYRRILLEKGWSCAEDAGRGLASCFCHWMTVWSLSNLHQLFPFSQHLLVLIDLFQFILQVCWRKSCSLLCMDSVHINPSCSICVLQNTHNTFAFTMSPKMPWTTMTKALSKSLNIKYWNWKPRSPSVSWTAQKGKTKPNKGNFDKWNNLPAEKAEHVKGGQQHRESGWVVKLLWKKSGSLSWLDALTSSVVPVGSQPPTRSRPWAEVGIIWAPDSALQTVQF